MTGRDCKAFGRSCLFIVPHRYSTSPTFRLNICIRTYVWILCAAVFYSFTRAHTRTARTPLRCAWGAGRNREKESERTCRKSARARTHTHTQRERDGEETRARVRVRRPVRHVRGRCATCRRPGGRPRGSKNPGRPSAQLPLPPRLADHVVIPLCRPAAQGVVDSGTRGRRAHSGGACRAP